MDNFIEIDNKRPKFQKIGNLIEDFLLSYLYIAPYVALFSALLIMAGLDNYFFMSISTFNLFLFLTLVFNINNKNERPKMGAMSDAEEELKQNLKNPKTIYYFAKFGTVVKDFKGTTPAQGRKYDLSPNNILYEYLVPKSLYTMGTLMAGATGAGKTVSLTSAYIHPLLLTGSGFVYIEGKGDRPISEGVYSLAVELGRENDVFFLDFGAVSNGGYSHSVAPLAIGNAVVLNETLTNLIDIMTGDNSWVSDMATELMQALLFPLVVLRDFNLFIKAEDIKYIEKLEDFKNFDKHDFTLTQLYGYMEYQAIIDLIYTFRKLLQEDEFIEMLRNHPFHKSLWTREKYKQSYLDELALFMQRNGVDVSNEFKKPIYNEYGEDTKKAMKYGITPWTKALSTFGNESIFGGIFNKEYPDINFLDAMRSGKIIIASLPSLQNSRDKNSKIGRMMTALIKNALGEMLSMGELEGTPSEKERQKRFRPYKLPYMLLFDEISNFGNETMGQMASMIRSIGVEEGGIGMLVSGQSETDLKRMGDNGIDGDQLKANLGISYFLNLSDNHDNNGYAKLASRYCGKKTTFDFQQDVILSKVDNNTSDLTRSLSTKEEEWYKEDYFLKHLKKQTGEGIIIENGFPQPEKIVANYIEPKKVFADDEKRNSIRLVKNISHRKLMTYFQIDFNNTTSNNTEEKAS